MKNLLSIFGRKDDGEIIGKSGILTNRGDKLEARITDTNRRVVKVQKDNGDFKYSATQYSNGTVVETKMIMFILFVIPV